MLQPRGQTPTDSKNKKKKTETPTIVIDKTSVAYLRGKRSCTQSDAKNYKEGGAISILSQIKQQQDSHGKRSVGPSSQPKAPSQQKGIPPQSLTQQADVAASGEAEHSYADYDFCHQCKQLKHQCLLV